MKMWFAVLMLPKPWSIEMMIVSLKCFISCFSFLNVLIKEYAPFLPAGRQGEVSGWLRLTYSVVHRLHPFCPSACIFVAAKQAAMYCFCIYNDSFFQKTCFQHDRPNFVLMTKPAHKEKDARKNGVKSGCSILKRNENLFDFYCNQKRRCV